jgi:hypothetical protein
MRFHRTVLGGTEISADVRTTLDREADALGVSFYVDKHVGDDDESLGFADDAPALPEDVLKRLREFATANGVNIYIHKAEYSNHPFENAITTGPSRKR